MTRPFRVGTLDEFTDRAREVSRVLDVMRSGGRLVLYGERRLGKTSILRKAAERLEADGGWVLFVDVWQRADLREVNRALLRQVPTTWLTGLRLERVMNALRGVARMGVDGAGRPVLSLSGSGSAPGEDHRDVFERILRGVNAVAGGLEEPVAVIFDEFQELESRVKGGAALLRGIAQDSGAVAYLFAGSVTGMVRDLIGPRGPFFGLPTLEVKAMDADHLARWIVNRLRDHGVVVSDAVGRAVVEATGGITSFALELGNAVHQAALDGGAPADGDAPPGTPPVTPDDVPRILLDVARGQGSRHEIVWRQLHATRRKILVALAHGETHIHAAAVRREWGLGSAQSVTYHRNTLRDEGLLLQADPPRIADPFFAAWIREGRS